LLPKVVLGVRFGMAKTYVNSVVSKRVISAAISVLCVGSLASAADMVVSGPVVDPYKSGTSIEVISQGSWKGAEAYAESVGGHLMSIASSAENTWVMDNLLVDNSGGLDLSNVPVWLGFSDPQSNDGPNHATHFVWSDGSPVVYTGWNIDEPNDDYNNNQSGGEHFTAINWNYAQKGVDQGTWDDTPNSGTGNAGSSTFGGNTDGPYYGLIEVTTIDVPEPTVLGGVTLMSVISGGMLMTRCTRRVTCDLI
jgi:Lectin C-type domain